MSLEIESVAGASGGNEYRLGPFSTIMVQVTASLLYAAIIALILALVYIVYIKPAIDNVKADVAALKVKIDAINTLFQQILAKVSGVAGNVGGVMSGGGLGGLGGGMTPTGVLSTVTGGGSGGGVSGIPVVGGLLGKIF